MCHISNFSSAKRSYWESVRMVVGLEFYASDIKVRYICGNGHTNNSSDNTRGLVTEFSMKSRKRLAFVAANTSVEFMNMTTLTYPAEYPSDGKTVKSHLNAFLTWARKFSGSIEYLWFLEFQERGAPHFHILHTAFLPKRKVSRRWYEIVGSKDRKHLLAGTRVERVRQKDGARRYAVKYATKMRQKEVPPNYQNVGRLWGHSRKVKPVAYAGCSAEWTKEDLLRVFSFWKYVDKLESVPMGTLYNLSGEYATIRQNVLKMESDR